MSFGVAITSDDTVLGFVEPTAGPRYVGLWPQGQLTDINFPIARMFRPTALNDDLIAVGSALNDEGERTACRWSFGRGLEFLAVHCPPLPGVELTDAVGINQAGQILCLGRHPYEESGFLLDPTP